MKFMDFVLLLLLPATLPGCNGETEELGPRFGEQPAAMDVPVYKLGVHPLHNPAKLVQAYQPLVDFLNSRLQNARLTLEASRDYANFEEWRTPMSRWNDDAEKL